MAVEHRTWQRFDRRERLSRYLFTLAAFVVVVGSWQYLDMSVAELGTAPTHLADLLGRMFPPHWGYTDRIVAPMVETIHIAVVGTFLAVVMSLPVAFLAAENTTPNRLTYSIGKFIVSVTRSVHIIVWALLFVVVFGPGAVAGTAAIAVRSVGFVAKLLGEEIEEIEFDQVEAIAATGASDFQSLFYGIYPQVKPALVGISVYRWDINVRGATILGFVGAGGIGGPLFHAINQFAWSTVAMIVIAILVVVLASEGISAYARRLVR
jgi:phosphonate transport system permease protein